MDDRCVVCVCVCDCVYVCFVGDQTQHHAHNRQALYPELHSSSLLCISYFEAGSHYAAQVAFELALWPKLTLNLDFSCSVSKVTGMTGLNHPPWFNLCL